MKSKLFMLSAVSALLAAAPVYAATVAHWRFEEGPAGSNVPHTIDAGQFEATIPDVSGNGNHLSVWEAGGNAGYAYRASVPFKTAVGINAPNNFSVKNTGGGPAMFTDSAVSLPTGTNIETMMPSTFTIEASYKPENGGYRTIVGRDAQNVVASNGALAAVYLQVRPNNSVGIGFADAAGNFHEAYSAEGVIQGFDFPTDNEGTKGNWYNLVGVSDGVNLKMYVNNKLVATTPITSTDARLAVGTTSGGDWHAGEWSVGRGLYNGGHADRAYGLIDEVRISDSALNPLQFLTPQALTLEVNRSTGAVTLKNVASAGINLDFLKISSAGGALSVAGWNSLDDQNFGAVDGPDGGSVAGDTPGEGWDQAGGSNANQLVEQFLGAAGSTIAGNQSFNLGTAYNTSIFGSVADGDLEFTYAASGGAVLSGLVTYVGGGGLPGDFNNSGKVDGADFLLWQRNFGQPGYDAASLAQWKANFGSGSAVAAAGAVPEPAAICMIVIAGAALAASRSKR